MWKVRSSSMKMPSPCLCLRELIDPWYLPLRQSKISVCIYYQNRDTKTQVYSFKRTCPLLEQLYCQMCDFQRDFFIIQMKDNYVSNIEQVLIANQTQKNKIEFLQRERVKREHYLDDLRENLHLNKATLREMNDKGPNLEAINKLVEQTEVLTQKLRTYYQEYQNINAVLLMQKQMRLEDKQFYNERMVEFENKMVDLRKYLHDKQDSFSSVVARLKKYEDLAESTLDQKLINYKKEIGERHINQFIAEILKQKNFYQKEWQNMNKQYLVFNQLKKDIINAHPEVQSMIQDYEKANKVKLDQLVKGFHHFKMSQEGQQREKKQTKKLKVDPNKQLIRLVKKQKLSKDLFEDALNEAIEKNEQLISIKNVYEKSIEKLEKKCALLYAENTIFALRLAEYDTHFSRYVTHYKQYYQEGQTKGLEFITEKRLKQYATAAKNYSTVQLNKHFQQRLRDEVQKWGEFMCDSIDIKRQLDKKGVMIRSASTPELLFNFDLDDVEGQNLIIEQF